MNATSCSEGFIWMTSIDVRVSGINRTAVMINSVSVASC